MFFRDGWKLKQHWKRELLGHPKYYQTLQPEVRERPSRNRKYTIRLTRSIKRLDYAEEFSVIHGKDANSTVIPRASWADWDQNGRLVFCRDGKVFAARIDDHGQLRETELADLNSSKPSPLPPPPRATRW